MPHFGTKSEAALATLEPGVQTILREAIKIYDFSVLCGFRDEAAQTAAFTASPRASHVPWPESVHNTKPSLAVDVAPWPLNWKDTLAFARLAGIIEAIAHEHGYRVRWGGDWDGDGGSRDQTFMDLGHLEFEHEG